LLAQQRHIDTVILNAIMKKGTRNSSLFTVINNNSLELEYPFSSYSTELYWLRNKTPGRPSTRSESPVCISPVWLTSLFFMSEYRSGVVYYESMKRKIKIKPI
jgi:hypothetical protein